MLPTVLSKSQAGVSHKICLSESSPISIRHDSEMDRSGATMGRSDWRPLRGIDQRRLSMGTPVSPSCSAMARAGSARLCSTAAGRRPHEFRLEHHLRRLCTCLSLKIADLTLVLHSDERTIQSFSLDGRTDAQAREWLGEQLCARGLDARALDASSPYEMPAHAVTQGGAYGVEDVADALVELAAWFANAEFRLSASNLRP